MMVDNALDHFQIIETQLYATLYSNGRLPRRINLYLYLFYSHYSPLEPFPKVAFPKQQSCRKQMRHKQLRISGRLLTLSVMLSMHHRINDVEHAAPHHTTGEDAAP